MVWDVKHVWEWLDFTVDWFVVLGVGIPQLDHVGCGVGNSVDDPDNGSEGHCGCNRNGDNPGR